MLTLGLPSRADTKEAVRGQEDGAGAFFSSILARKGEERGEVKREKGACDERMTENT